MKNWCIVNERLGKMLVVKRQDLKLKFWTTVSSISRQGVWMDFFH